MSEFEEGNITDEEKTFVAPKTGEDNIMDETRPENVSSRLEASLNQAAQAVSHAQEILSRQELTEQQRKDWELQLKSDQEQLAFWQEKIQEHNSRH